MEKRLARLEQLMASHAEASAQSATRANHERTELRMAISRIENGLFGDPKDPESGLVGRLAAINNRVKSLESTRNRLYLWLGISSTGAGVSGATLSKLFPFLGGPGN